MSSACAQAIRSYTVSRPDFFLLEILVNKESMQNLAKAHKLPGLCLFIHREILTSRLSIKKKLH